ncbi:MAG TPA: exodeoxyribonuclease VII small subunit [Nitrospirae bacterium]|nr:exodeoxyribonuclease VII small subunit [Nitrospirota bacterium]HDH05018.1 exodeoxyribonuclease VII small subunit [Nitrospirota bacterium]
MKDAPTYKDAVEEIDSIVEEIENEDVDVDILTEKVKRATFLIKYCKDKLRKTDDEVKKALKEFEKEEEGMDSEAL